ncbi:hypothetical protein B0H13DRAFT_1899458 [Mycena leptocephala]|nr:hypothetical protein B0H13DRAFT_1899458 [Mycena leptocephala]
MHWVWGSTERMHYEPVNCTPTTRDGNADDVSAEADNEREDEVPMIIDDANDAGAIFDAALALAAQEDAPAPTAVYNVNAAPGHAFQFDNGQQAAAHIASAAADAATGQMLPDAISPRAQPHPLVDANNQQGGPIPVGNGTRAFVFADPQQAAAHFAGAANNTAPMYVFGAQGGDPMIVVPAPGAPTHPDAAAMQGVIREGHGFGSTRRVFGSGRTGTGCGSVIFQTRNPRVAAGYQMEGKNQCKASVKHQ